ncbi:MAG: S-methyl-5'-thioinosine phosphorylase [Actinomycetota bacterium]|nr:S-methyl-5'-thioinosine phosphorylase [Actinomycetota bacterium]
MKRFGIIGGSGLYDIPGLDGLKDDNLVTPHGKVLYAMGRHADREVIFIPRHGRHHDTPPHLINYKANIMAFKLLGVEAVLATAASGSLNLEMEVGDFVLLDQFIDFTKNREESFFNREGSAVHIDLSHPYCPSLRGLMLTTAKELGVTIHPKATYICTEGPRFETVAEINGFKVLGGDLVGMTNYPEVALAREAEICYATVAVVTNMAAGISMDSPSSSEVSSAMAASIEHLLGLLLKTVEKVEGINDCDCRKALSGSKMRAV